MRDLALAVREARGNAVGDQAQPADAEGGAAAEAATVPVSLGGVRPVAPARTGVEEIKYKVVPGPRASVPAAPPTDVRP